MTKKQREIVAAMIIGETSLPTRPLNQIEIEALDAWLAPEPIVHPKNWIESTEISDLIELIKNHSNLK